MRLGIIGLKGHQNRVFEGARELGDVHLVAASDESEAKLKEAASLSIAKDAETFRGWRHLLDHSELDVCCVCDENGVRAEQLIELAKRNIHIITEKPLATNLEDLERIREALANSRSRLTMLLTMRHEAKYATMREVVQSGVIGEPALATAQKSYQLHTRPAWFKERKRLGGTIPYIGIHAIDMMRWLTGFEYTHAAAFHGRIGHPEIQEAEDHGSVLLRMTNGASATARLDYLRPSKAPSHGDDRVRIAGSKGVVEAVYTDKMIRVVTEEKKPYHVKPKPTANIFADWVRALRSGRRPRIPAEDCFYATEVVLHARQAADEKKLIELPAFRAMKEASR